MRGTPRDRQDKSGDPGKAPHQVPQHIRQIRGITVIILTAGGRGHYARSQLRISLAQPSAVGLGHRRSGPATLRGPPAAQDAGRRGPDLEKQYVTLGGVMGTTRTWMLLWILLALGLGVTGGFLIARGLRNRRGAAPPRSPLPNRPLCGKPKMRCGCGMRTAKSAGKTICRARSSWKTDALPLPGPYRPR